MIGSNFGFKALGWVIYVRTHLKTFLTFLGKIVIQDGEFKVKDYDIIFGSCEVIIYT